MPSPSDDQLMARLRGGDGRAFDALYERYRVFVFTFLVRLVRRRDLAEDLLQETFLRVYRARHDYESGTRFRSWLFTIARRLVIDHYRRAHLEWEAGDPVEEAVPPVMERRVEAREFLARAERALHRLPPAYRELILLSRVAGMDAGEIARVTGSTPGAVRVGLHRALKRLRALIEAEGDL